MAGTDLDISMNPAVTFRPTLGETISAIASQAHEQGVPGIALAIDVDGETIAAEAGTADVFNRRPLNSQSRFRVACIGHLLLAIATHNLCREGRLDLSQSVAEYFPELQDCHFAARTRIRHLLSHSTGFVSPPDVSADDSSSVLAAVPRALNVMQPGLCLLYEPRDTVILGALLGRCANQSIETLVQSSVLTPLGIATRPPGSADVFDVVSQSHTRRVDERAFATAPNTGLGELRLRLRDLLILCHSLYPQERAPGQSLFTPVVHAPESIGVGAARTSSVAFSLGCGMFADGLWGLNGIGVGQCIAFRADPQRRISFAVGILTEDVELRQHICDLLAKLLGIDGGAHAQTVTDVTDATIERLPGTYVQPFTAPCVRAIVAVANGTLSLTIREGSRSSPTFHLLQRCDSGTWVASEHRPKRLPIGFVVDDTLPEALGLMFGTAHFWRSA